MLLHFARISVITIAVALVAGVGFLLARPQAPTVITVVVPQAQVTAAAPTTVVEHVGPYWGWGYYGCGARVCWR